MAIERNVIEPVAGVSNEIGFYLAEMNEVREQLREAVSDLTREQVAERAVEGAHSIGALALHIGEAEWYWIECVMRIRTASSGTCSKTRRSSVG